MQFDDSYFERHDQHQVEIFLAAYTHLSREMAAENPNRGSSHYQFGRLFESVNLFSSAVEAYKQSIRHNTNDLPSYIALADLYAQHGLHYSEKNVYRQLVAVLPEEHDMRDVFCRLDSKYPDRTVTFYLPCYNVEKFIRHSLQGICDQTFSPLEILVIDDGCSDKTIDIAKGYPVRVIAHNVNKGLAAARNTALRHAAGEFIASVDTDAVPDPYWLERLILSFTAKEVAGVGGKLIEKNTVTAVDRWRQIILKQQNNPAAPEDVSLYGSNTVFRVNALKAIGGYNEYFRTNFEDMDVCKRLLRQGFRTRYNSEAVCRHLRVDSLQSATNTLYNWQKPAWEIEGAYENQELFAIKGSECLRSGLQHMTQLLDSGHFETLYASFVSTLRTLLKDILLFYKRAPCSSMRSTFIAAYLAIIHQLKNSKKFSDQLIQWVQQDLADLVSDMLEIRGTSRVTDFNHRVSAQAAATPDLMQLFAAWHVIDGARHSYLLEMLERLMPLLAPHPTVAAMLHTSARRMRYEEENPPYANAHRIMLLNPPWRPSRRRGVRAGSRWPFTFAECRPSQALTYTPYPFFLCYLSSILKENRIPNVIVDGVAEDLTYEDFIERVAGYEPGVVVMETSTASFRTDTLWLLKIKERLPHVRAIWVGAHASALAETIIRENPMVDFIVQGEYEKTAAHLIERIVNGQDPGDLKGLVFATAEGKIINTGRAELIEDLDALPWPERLTVPIYKYNDLFAGMRYPSLQIHGSRGCPFGCIYCVWPQVLYGGKIYRARNPFKILDEIEHAVREYGFNSVYFDDDTFNIGKKRMLAICEEFAHRDLNISWGAMARADTSDFETLQAMKIAGMVGIKFGVESGVQELVDRAEKGLQLAAVEKAIGWCRELGIKTHLTFTFGLPGETHQTIRQTIDFAKRMNPDSIQFSITTPFPGTKYFDWLKESGNLLSEEWDRFDGAQYTVIRTDALTQEDLQAALKMANSEYFQHRLTAVGSRCPTVTEEAAV